MKEAKLDALGIQEHNLNLQVMYGRHTWKNRFSQWHKLHTSAAGNIHTTFCERHLYGGTAVFVGQDHYHRVNGNNTDTRGMGRWNWVLLQGQHGMKLRIISGYRPVSDHTNRPHSVFSQQEQVLLKHKDFRNPREAMLNDLQACIEGWQSDGDMIILGMDANEDVTKTPDQFARSCNLIPVMTNHHKELALPATCNKNTKDVAVDGIWCSPGLDIQQCGMAGFGEIHVGSTDHRLLWVDVTKKSAFGYDPPPPTYTQPNRINLKDPRCVRKYNREVAKGHERENLINRLRKIIDLCQETGPTPILTKQYDDIAQRDMKIREEARKLCRRLCMGKVPFSDEIQRWHRMINMWNLIILKRKGKKVDSRNIRRIMQQTDNMEALLATDEEALANKRSCLKAYRKVKKNASELRGQFGVKVAEARAKKYKTSIETQTKLTKHVFRQKAAFSRIGAVMKSPRLSIAYVTDGSKELTNHHYSKEDIEQSLMREGTARFLQAYGTPFTEPPLVTDFPHLLHESVEEVLKGTYEPPDGTGEFVRKLLKQLELPPGVPLSGNIGAELDVDAHIAGWKKMKGKTNSSPFGPSFADYIAGCEDRVIATFDALMGFIPSFMGMIPQSWLHVIDAMIPKKSNSTHVQKMRMIVLFHALHNFQNKRFGRNMVYGMELRHQIPLEAYGSRKKHRAIECAINKVLTTDHIRQRHLTAALCSNDAKSCYDRILHIVAEICMRRAGLIKEPCYMMLGSMEEMKHHIRTIYGDSHHSYTALALPFQGVFQGNGAGPAIWLIVSIPIINMLKEEGFGLKTVTAITGIPFDLVCYTFVDDTDLIHCLPAGNHDTEQLVVEMQSMLDHWEGGISATGGALVPEKSYWFLMSFYWKRDKWHYRSRSSTPGILKIKDTNGDITELERLPVNAARETLGTWIAMDGNQEAQYDALEDKILKWGDKIRGNALSRTDAMISVRSSLSPSLQYPLAACTIKRNKLQDLTKLLMKLVLPTLGIPPSTPRHLLHAPDLQVGYQLPCLEVETGFYQLEVLLRNLHDHKLTGKLLHDTYECFQLEMGVATNPLCYSYKQWKSVVTPCWISRVWEFCSRNNIMVDVPSISIPLLRVEDKFLMQHFVDNGFSGEELRLINLCRKWHKVWRLSEITTGDGRFIQQAARSADQCVGTGDFNWPVDHQPSPRCWKLWNDALDTCFIDLNDKAKRLRRPLGDWTTVPSTWQWFVSPSDERIYQRISEEDVRFYIPSTRNTRRPRFSFTGNATSLPGDAVPTSCFGSTNFIRHEGHCRVLQPQHPAQGEHWWNKRLLETEHRLESFFTGVEQGTAVIICDGSFKDDWGTAAIISIPHIDSREPVLSAHLTPGPKSAHCAYRAELAGILASVISVEEESAQFGVTTGSITIGCDCDAALNTYLYCRTGRPKPDSHHYDLTSQLFTLLHKSKFKWLGREIKGHQDDIRAYHELDVWERWNVDVDTLAKFHWATVRSTFEESIPFYNLPPLQEPSIWMNGQRVVSWNKTDLYKAIFQPEVTAYLEKRYHIDHKRIDLEAMGKAFKATPMFKRLWLTKLLSNRLPTMENLSKWTQDNQPNTCPRCGREEDNDHITWCDAPKSRSFRQRCISKLEIHLLRVHTSPSIRERILSLLQQDDETTPIGDDDDITHTLLTKGFIPNSWTESQQSYYTWLERRTTGKRWAARLITQLWEISWDMWHHRKKIDESPESLLSAQRHANLNELIQIEWNYQLAAPNQYLNRWFTRPRRELFAQSIDFKQQWLEAVSVIRQAHLDNH